MSQVIGELLDYQVDGIFTASVAMSNDLTRRCASAGIPSVMFNRGQSNLRFSEVTSCDEAGGRGRQASAKVELDDFLHRKPSELSVGRRQRVALARAIVGQPSVFRMDEPLSHLDAKLRVSTRAH